MLSSNIIQINTKVPSDICIIVATQVKCRRLELNLTQGGLSARAGVNIETYRKFERTGEISLHNLVKLAFALEALANFELLFVQPQFQSIDALLSAKNVTRKRGKKA